MNKVEKRYVFRVPIFSGKSEDNELNKLIRSKILEKYEESEGVQGSNREGGWQSRHNLHEWSVSGVDRLLRNIQELVNEAVRVTVDNPRDVHFENWRLHAWANVNVKGAYNESHDHYSWSNLPVWSGIYYVDPGQSVDGGSVGGETVFEDRVGVPRAVNDDQGSSKHEVSIEPQKGLMVMFPSTLRHRVEPYQGDSRRITIAWNLFHPDFQIPNYDEEEEDSSSKHQSETLWHAKQVVKSLSRAVRNPSILLHKLGVAKDEEGGDEDNDPLREYLRDVSELDPGS